MRSLNLLISLLITLSALGQSDEDRFRSQEAEKDLAKKKSEQSVSFPIDSSTGKFSFVEVVKVDSVDAGTLYSRAKLFIANAFVSAQDVTQLADENTKTVVCKGNMTAAVGGVVRFTLTIQCKDGRYRFSLTDFYHSFESKNMSGGNLENEKPACGGFNMIRSQWAKIKNRFHDDASTLITAMKTSLQSTKTSEW
jgi:hypothetical protein